MQSSPKSTQWFFWVAQSRHKLGTNSQGGRGNAGSWHALTDHPDQLLKTCSRKVGVPKIISAHDTRWQLHDKYGCTTSSVACSLICLSAGTLAAWQTTFTGGAAMRQRQKGACSSLERGCRSRTLSHVEHSGCSFCTGQASAAFSPTVRLPCEPSCCK